MTPPPRGGRAARAAAAAGASGCDHRGSRRGARNARRLEGAPRRRLVVPEQTATISVRVFADRIRGVLRRRHSGATAYPRQRGDGLWRSVVSDVRCGLRHLGRNRGFAATATLVIALGIGPNTAILALANAAFLQPLPYPHADRLGLIPMEFGGVNQGGFSVSHRDMQTSSASRMPSTTSRCFSTGRASISRARASRSGHRSTSSPPTTSTWWTFNRQSGVASAPTRTGWECWT